jgi:AraC-like DNA-binding protein
MHGVSIVADPNYALFFNRGESYRVSHPVAGGDRCTVLAFATGQIQDCLVHLDPDVLSSGTRFFSSTHTPTSPALDLLHRRLLRAAGGQAELLAIEEIAIDLLAELISASNYSAGAVKQISRRAATIQRYDDLIMAVREELTRRLGEKLDLGDLASSVHVSPFHLSRVFRLQTGFSLSSYHRRLRLRTALQRILDGEDDLTRLAVELGFSHHSHFTSAFSKEFGIPPSANREQLNATELRSAATAIRRHMSRDRKKTI